MHNRNRSMRGEFMSTIEQLEKQRDELDKQIAAMEKQSFAEERSKPLAALRRKREALLAKQGWPILVIVAWHPANTWMHAHEHWLNFKTGEVCYRRSESGWSGGFGGHFSLPSVFGRLRERDAAFCSWYNENYFLGKKSNVPYFKQYVRDFAPYQTLAHRYWDGVAGRVVFLSQVVVCPICGEVERQPQNEREQVLYNLPYVDAYHLYRANGREIGGMAKVADAYLKGDLFDNGLIFQRCKQCHRKSFRGHWRELHKKLSNEIQDKQRFAAESDRKWRPWKQEERAARQIARLWTGLQLRQEIKQSIFRQAKKRARIKPLSRGELAFFSMHLAATQMKQLKAMEN
jgi:hypothetical protein